MHGLAVLSWGQQKTAAGSPARACLSKGGWCVRDHPVGHILAPATMPELAIVRVELPSTCVQSRTSKDAQGVNLSVLPGAVDGVFWLRPAALPTRRVWTTSSTNQRVAETGSSNRRRRRMTSSAPGASAGFARPMPCQRQSGSRLRPCQFRWPAVWRKGCAGSLIEHRSVSVVPICVSLNWLRMQWTFTLRFDWMSPCCERGVAAIRISIKIKILQ